MLGFEAMNLPQEILRFSHILNSNPLFIEVTTLSGLTDD